MAKSEDLSSRPGPEEEREREGCLDSPPAGAAMREFMAAPAGQRPMGPVDALAGGGLDDPLASTDEEPDAGEDQLQDEFAK